MVIRTVRERRPSDRLRAATSRVPSHHARSGHQRHLHHLTGSDHEQLRERRQLQAEVRDMPGRAGSVQHLQRIRPGGQVEAEVIGAVLDDAHLGERREPAPIPVRDRQAQLPAPGGRPQVGDPPLQHRAPLVEHHDRLAEVLDEIELVAGEQHGATGMDPFGQGGAQLGHRDRVEAGERLVEHDHLRVVHQGRGQLQPLLHAAGQLVRPIRPPVTKAQLVEKASGRSGGLRTVDPVQSGEVDQLFPRGHRGVEAPLLGHVAPAAAIGGGHRMARPPRLSRIGIDDPEHDPHERGLACAVGSEEPHQHPGRDVEGHVVEDRPLGEGMRHLAHLEHTTSLPRCRGRLPARRPCGYSGEHHIEPGRRDAMTVLAHDPALPTP